VLDGDLLDAEERGESRPSYSENGRSVSGSLKGENGMAEYRFAVIVACAPTSHEKILDAADLLATAGCTDASIRGHADGMEVLFDRSARSLQSAMASAIKDIERAGFRAIRVEMEREALRV
jgi:hypothetical protein